MFWSVIEKGHSVVKYTHKILTEMNPATSIDKENCSKFKIMNILLSLSLRRLQLISTTFSLTKPVLLLSITAAKVCCKKVLLPAWPVYHKSVTL